jgi:hypothetical protein
MLNLDFEKEVGEPAWGHQTDCRGDGPARAPLFPLRQIDQLLRVIPRDRHTYLFSATMTSKARSVAPLFPSPAHHLPGS